VHVRVWCLKAVAVVVDQTQGIAAKGRSAEVVGEGPRLASLPPLLLLESLLARRCWVRRRRLLEAGEAGAVILPAPGVVEERMKEVEEGVLVATTARQMRVPGVPGHLVKEQTMIYWRMACGSRGAGAASCLWEEGGPLVTPRRLGAERRRQSF
jgi:hypothetical protein